MARGELRGRQAVGEVPAAKLRRGRREVASAAFGPGAQRDGKLLEPGAHRAAADPEPLADLGGDQPLLLVESAQLGR
jgi:hypothetical protein